MAIKGNLVNQWHQGDDFCVAVAIDEGAKAGGTIEYNVCVPWADLDGKTTVQQRAYLVGAVKAERAKQTTPDPPSRPSVSLPTQFDL